MLDFDLLQTYVTSSSDNIRLPVKFTREKSNKVNSFLLVVCLSDLKFAYAFSKKYTSKTNGRIKSVLLNSHLVAWMPFGAHLKFLASLAAIYEHVKIALILVEQEEVPLYFPLKIFKVQQQQR